MTVDINAQGWFITLFARRAPVRLALRVWDLLLSVREKPHMIVFLGLALLIQNKHKLLHDVSLELVPETLVRLQLVEEEIDATFAAALELETRTPASFVLTMRSVGFDGNMSEIDRAPALYGLIFLPCVVASAEDTAALLVKPSSTARYVVVDCSPDLSATTIEGSLHVSPAVVDELCKVVDGQLAAAGWRPSPNSHPVLSALWTCCAKDVFLVLCGGAETTSPPLSMSKSPGPNGDSVAAQARHLKGQEAKRHNLLPCNQLATALLVLGYSHVSVVKGEGSAPGEEFPTGGRDALVR